MKMLFYSLAIIFVLTGCAGTQAGGSSSGGYDSNSKSLTKEQLKQMGVDENKGYYN